MIREGGTNASNGAFTPDISYCINAIQTADSQPFTDTGESPGFAGVGESHVTAEGVPGTQRTRPDYFWKGGSDATWIFQEEGGEPGRVGRLAYDAKGPAYSGSTADFGMTGARVNPDSAKVRHGGPVGQLDVGAYNAIAIAQSTRDFPDEALAQLQIVLGT